MARSEHSKYRQDVSLGHGRRKSVYARTKKGLASKVAALITQVENNTVVDPSKAIFSEVAEWWLQFHLAEKEITESTYAVYSQIIAMHLVPLFGKTNIQHLTEHAITQKMATRHHLASSTRRRIFVVLHMILRHAKRLKIITTDPMEFVTFPSPRNRVDREIFCLNVEQAQRFVQACKGNRLENLFILALTTGVREGELLSTRVSDFADDFNLLHIRRTLTDDKQGRPKIKNHPKTIAGRRTISLPEMARKAVLEEMAFRLKEGNGNHELLFVNRFGDFFRRQSVMVQHFTPTIKQADLKPAMRFHDLRHTYATLALNAGIGVHLVSKMLGHTSIKTTIDLYGHALPEATADAANIMNALLTSASKKGRRNA